MKSFQKLFMKRIIMSNVIILLQCKKNTESINPKVSKTTNGKAIILSTCAICGSKIKIY